MPTYPEEEHDIDLIQELVLYLPNVRRYLSHHLRNDLQRAMASLDLYRSTNSQEYADSADRALTSMLDHLMRVGL